jgi:threonine-phosphate decarboxylase
LSLPTHGANPHYLYEALGMEMPAARIDFSANINPLGPPASLAEHWPSFYNSIIHYPDPYAVELTKKVAAKEGLPESCVLIGNGGAEIITLVGRMLAEKKVLIIQPAFAEYAEACHASGCEVSFYKLQEPNWELELEPLRPLLQQHDAVFLCTPNNPTGISFSEEAVQALVEESERAGCMVIIDEAFYDFTDDAFTYASLVAENEHVIILRSLTKMFAIPGLRLGYLLANEEFVGQMKVYKPHWSVNAIALAAGQLCIEEEAYMEQTRAYIRKQKQRLFAFFAEHGFQISNSSINFYLLKDRGAEDSAELLEFLLKKGIIPRHTYNFPGLDGRWLRFAVKSEQDNTVLMEALRQWRNLHSTL